MPSPWNPHWPILTKHDASQLEHIALPLGGIGTGTVSLGGRGQLRDFEVMNRPAKGYIPSHCFFALWCRPKGGETVTRAIEGMLPQREYFGATGSNAPNHGLPRFRECQFAAAYPFGQVALHDPQVPVAVRIEAFNPLVPPDAERSGMPVAVLRFVLTNRTSQTVDAAVCGNLNNFIGNDGGGPNMPGPRDNHNTFRSEKGLAGVVLSSDGVPDTAEQSGTIVLATTSRPGLSHRTGWFNGGWGGTILDFWDDFSEDGAVAEPTQLDGASPLPIASLATRIRLKPRESRAVTFILAWHFPNRMTWTPTEASATATASDACCEDGSCDTGTSLTVSARRDPNWIGNYYTTQFADAWAAAALAAKQLPALERDTISFVSAVCESDLPQPVREAALYNLSTLRTQTCFRTPDGKLYGWEGCGTNIGCCRGSCTHVWNYEQATAMLFGGLSRGMRDVEFLHCTNDVGCMSFRVGLPLEEKAQEFGRAAADGQMGCLMKLHRDWKISGDDDWLRQLWPKAKQALAFCWIPGGWDADRDGVMEGCQHNTMDVEYFGPNPQMTGWYLGALRAAEEMANHLEDREFAATCRALFDRGSQWMDDHLFNGEYYEHHVVPITDISRIAEGLVIGMGSNQLSDPAFQLGKGCLVDQLVGQYFAHVSGLGYLHDPAKVRKTLASIWKHNRLSTFRGHFNNMRSYVLGDEAAILMASYPRGERPKSPFPYFNEVMTGFEYTAAVHMLYEGMTEQGLQAIADIRHRYTGQNRNPFDEAECGHHYARAMASWAAVLALTGFDYDATRATMTFHKPDRKARWFWSTGDAWGTVELTPGKRATTATLNVLAGQVKLRTLRLREGVEATLDRTATLRQGATRQFRLAQTRG